MRLKIEHLTRYTYEPAARAVIQVLRLTPRDHAAQTVIDWRVEADIDARLRRTVDAYGNVVHLLQSQGPVSTLTLHVRGEVETTDQAGVLSGQAEPQPPAVFLRPTDLTAWDERLEPLIDGLAQTPAGVARMHDLMDRIRRRMTFEAGATSASTSATEALAIGRGVCQDFSHLFIAAARRLGTPSRYVSGHLFRRDGDSRQTAAHAWAEVWIEDLGWVGFDPANGICPDDAYVRVAVGPDYLDAAPVRGASLNSGLEALAVDVRVSEVADAARPQPAVQVQGPARRQAQSQSQS